MSDKVILVVIGSLGGGMADVEQDVRKVFKDEYRIEEVQCMATDTESGIM